MVALLVMVSILTTLVVVFVVVPKLRPTATREAAVPAPEPPALTVPAATPPVVSVAATPSATPSTNAPVATTARSVQRGKAAHAPAPAGAPAKKADCAVPYTYDADGRHWKPECVE